MEHGLEEARGGAHVAALHADVDELVERQHVRLDALGGGEGVNGVE